LNEPEGSTARLKPLFARIRRFTGFLFGRFLDDRGLMTATALSYTTLLSIVPLLVVVFSTLASFPAFEYMVERMQGYVFRNFVPAAGETILTYVRQFVERAGTLTGIGGAFLILGALLLMITIDDAINHIWRVRRRRRLVLKMAVYWTALTLGPVLLAVSIAGTSYIMTLPEADSVVRGMVRLVLSITPFLFTTLALTLLYVFVPNCRVPFRNGLIAAVTAAVVFEFAKAAFAGYVAKGTAYATVYGALAVIPLFLTWIYMSWVIVLIGAELSFCLTAFRGDRPERDAGTAVGELLAAYRVLGHLWRAQIDGRAVSSKGLLEREPTLTVLRLGAVLDRLQSHNVIYGIDTGDWALGRDAGEFTLRDLYRIFPVPLLARGDWDREDWGEVLGARMRKARARIDEGLEVLDVPLKALYREEVTLSFHREPLSAPRHRTPPP